VSTPGGPRASLDFCQKRQACGDIQVMRRPLLLWRTLEANVGGTVDYQTATMDIADYLKQGGQTAGHRELWRLLKM
jgi:hypothetical protein